MTSFWPDLLMFSKLQIINSYMLYIQPVTELLNSIMLILIFLQAVQFIHGGAQILIQTSLLGLCEVCFIQIYMNEWMYIAHFLYWCIPKVLYTHVRCLSSTTILHLCQTLLLSFSGLMQKRKEIEPATNLSWCVYNDSCTVRTLMG